MTTILITLFSMLGLVSSVNAQTINPSSWQTGAIGLRTSNANGNTAGLTITVNATTTPFLSVRGGVKNVDNNRLTSAMNLPLGQVKIPGMTHALISESSDWSHDQLNFSSGLTVWVSRLSPAILIQSQSASLRVLTGTTPKYIAYSSGGTVRVQTLSTNTFTVPVLDDNWLLVWYGNNSPFNDTKVPTSYSPDLGYDFASLPGSYAYQADVPILFRLQNQPSTVNLSPEGGIEMNSSINTNNTLIIPLLGDDHPTSAATESWSSGLPPVIQNKINFWTNSTNNRLCSYPTTVTESYNYNSSNDTSTITENITYLNVCSGGSTTSGFALLPPILSLAMESNNPLGVSVSGSVTDPAYATLFGPIRGIDNTNQYSWSVAGLKKFTDSNRLPSSGQVPADLNQEMTNQIQRIITAGHLRPWVFSDNSPRGDNRGDIYFLNPADEIYHLTEITGSLSPSQLKTDLISYIRSERSLNPPETAYNMSFSSGTPRSPFSNSNPNNMIANGPQDLLLKKMPLYNFHALSRYYKLTGDPVPASVMTAAKSTLNQEMTERDWSTFYPFKGFNQDRIAVVGSNRHLAGIIGYTALARMTTDQTESLSRALLTKAAVQRVAFAKQPRYLYATNLATLPTDPLWQVVSNANLVGGWIYSYNYSGAYDDARQVTILDQFNLILWDHSGWMDTGDGGATAWKDWIYDVSTHLIAYRDMVPEVYRLLNNYAKQDTEVYLNNITTLLPNWYLAFGEAAFGAEHNVNHPADNFQLFMAKALLQVDTPQNLEKYLDISWLDSGDLFYMHKLAETIKAYQGWVWEDELAGVTPTTVPTACALTSASWSNTGPMVEGTSVNLTINTSGDCNGKNIEIKVFDDDGSALLNDEVATLPQVTAYGSTVTTSWVTVYTPDSDDPADILGDRLPEYFFEARVVNESGFTNSPYAQELVVTQNGGR